MKKKNNILLVSQFFWPESFPINSIIKKFKKFKFTVITAKPNYPEGKIFKKYLKSGVIREKFNSHYIYHVPVIPRKSGNSFFLFLNYISFLFSSIYYGKKYLKKSKFDVIFVYNTSPITQIITGYYFKKLFKIKLITWVQDIWPESVSATDHITENLFFKIFRKFCHSIYKLNDLIILQSNYFYKYFTKYKIKVKKAYVPNSSNIDLSKINKYKVSLKNKSRYNIVYAGNIGMAQHFENFEIFLQKLYKKNKHIKFHLIGSGSYKNILINKIKNKKLKNIEIYPYIKNKYLYNYLSEADVLFVSLKDKYIFNLTIPSKLQNYLACKKPILAWANGITKEIIINANCGYVVKPGNITKLINATLKITNKNYIKKMGRSSDIYYKKNFDLRIIISKLSKIINNSIN